jgi:hypothetical protein
VARLGLLALIVVALGAAVAVARADDEATPLTVRCDAKAWQAFLEPSGQVRLLEYRFGTQYNNWKPSPTGRVMAYIDATTQRISPDCTRVTRRAFVPRGLVGPYPRDVRSRVFCSSNAWPGDGKLAHYTLLQFRTILDRKKHRVGTRLIATINATPVINAFMSLKGGGISYEPIDHCVRNWWP